MLKYELKKLVGQKIILVFIVARAGLIISKFSCKGTLKGRPCKRDFNDFDLFAIKADRGNAIMYIDLSGWQSDSSYMITLERVNVLGGSAVPILHITFNPS